MLYSNFYFVVQRYTTEIVMLYVRRMVIAAGMLFVMALMAFTMGAQKDLPLWYGGWLPHFIVPHGCMVIRRSVGCGVDVVFVSCRRLLKYIIYEILHRKERKGRKARAVGSFAVFAHFAVRC